MASTNTLLNNVSASLLLLWLVFYFIMKLNRPELERSWTIATLIVASSVLVFMLVSINVTF
jgi:hypothetical protein